MEADVAVKIQAMNPCCAALKEKCSKLEGGRNALRQAVKIQEDEIDKLQIENLNLKEAYEKIRAQADTERQDKDKELAVRLSLENEVCALKSGMLLLQQNGSSQVQNVDGEVMILQTRLAEGETEINWLKDLVEKERMKAEAVLKNAEAQKKEANKALKIVDAEKCRADEERRIADLEWKKSEENRIMLEKLKSEADEARSKLVLEVLKVDKANKKLEEERRKMIKEKKRADSATAKAEEQRNLAETNQKKAIDEKCRADNLSQQLEEHRQRIEKLRKEMDELVSSQKLVKAPADTSDKQMKAEIGEVKVGLPLDMLKREIDESKLVLEDRKSENISRRIKEGKNNLMREKKRADSEMRKAEEHRQVAEVNKKKATEEKHRADSEMRKAEEYRKVAEANKKKATEEKHRADSEMRKAEEYRKVAEANKKKATDEKHRADQFAQQLEDSRHRVDELQKEIPQLASSRTVVQSPIMPPDKIMDLQTGKMKLLKDQLKLKKKQLKHTKEIAKLEIGRNKILQQELHCLKQIGTPCLNLKRECFSKEPHQVHLYCHNELVRPSCRTLDASDYMKQTIECTHPLLPLTRGNYSQCITGIDSKMEPLLRGSNRKILQSSAINSSTSSFTDRPLMGSQESRGAFSVTTSARVAEEKSKSQSNISSLCGEVTKTRDNENLAVRAENSVGNPVSIDAVGRKARDSKKRRRILNAVKSIEHLYSEGKRWHLQIEQKLSMLYGMLNSQVGKSPDAEQARAHKKRKVSPEEVALQHMCRFNKLKDIQQTRGVEGANVCTQAFPQSNDLRGIVQACEYGISDSGRSIQENLGSYEELMDGNYIKLLDLDNAADEDCYRKAIQVPLSPTLPVIECEDSEAIDINDSKHLVDKRSYEGFSTAKTNYLPSCNIDVINVEIDPNQLKLGTSETSHVAALPKNCGTTDPFRNFANNGHDNCDTGYEGNSCGHQMWASLAVLGVSDMCISGYKGTNISCEIGFLRACDDIPRYCVVFSDIKDCRSIARIFNAAGTCISQCSMIDQAGLVIQKILPALSKIEDLLPKEKACVFFSVLLHNFSGIVFKDFRNFLERDSILLDSLAVRIHGVVSDVQTRSMVAELYISGELLTLIEDFLIDRRILVYVNPSDTLPECGSRVNIPLNGEAINLSSEMASTHQLVAGGIVLAALCAAIDHIGFLCEASYNFFRTNKLDASLALTILHVFAYVCGSKYFSLKEYCMTMTVVKSLVTFLENRNLSSEFTSCHPSTNEDWPEFPKCTKCPFSEDVVSLEIVVSLLLQKLQNYVLPGTIHQDPRESVKSLNFELLPVNDKTDKILGHEGEFQPMSCSTSCCLMKFDMPTTELNSVYDGNFCHFSDVLSLVELLACNMSWGWTCNKIMHKLLNFLESGVQDNYFAATVILLGKLGRLGVDAGGYEDKCVENLRQSLCNFLCLNSSRKLGFPAQIATVNALLGLLSVDFEELIKSTVKLPKIASPSTPVDCIREWYSILSCEQQSLSSCLLQSACVRSCSTR